MRGISNMTLPTQTSAQINLDAINFSQVCARCHEFRGKHLGIAYADCRDGGSWEEPK